MALAERISGMAENGPPPQDAAALYVGDVMHARLRPVSNRFTYRVFSLLSDIDRLHEIAARSPLFSVNRPALVSLHEADHVEREGESLRDFADRLLSEAGLAQPAKRILLLAYPRIFGYVFNPLSVFFAYGEDDALLGLIYCVRNTFGERHSYVALLKEGELSPAGVRQSRAKIFHVSPFIGMQARYDFRILPPGKTVRLRINETEEGQPLLAATFIGAARPFGTASLASCLAGIPFMTFKVIGAIHWQALRLWWKGAAFHKSPATGKSVSFNDNSPHIPEPGE